jgi:hypothetical protein
VAETSQGIWATIGKIGAVIGLLLGLQQVYVHFIKTEISVQGEGWCQPTYLPGSLFQDLKIEQALPTTDQIEKSLPKELDNKYQVASTIHKLNSTHKTRFEEAVSDLKSIRSYCSFTVFNNGNKEAQDIKFELPREGIYFIERLGEEPKEAQFKKVIPIGKLNPGGKVSIATWHQGYSSHEPFASEHADFRITHTLGIGEVEFLSQNTTVIGWLYERHPYISLLLFLGILFVAGWIGVSMERTDAQEKAKKELEKKVELEKETEEAKAKATTEATQVEPPQEADTAPPSPS